MECKYFSSGHSHGSSSSADVTLNALNASESEVDVEGLGSDRLDFGNHHWIKPGYLLQHS